ncbi:MAG TPA: hypothetical protein P5268_06380 [Candidatus Marinimicrobia bacterium]|nr:hypothetical protein [Candidatus Neomarinimicrobiota bacterium]HRS51810.1 hypothetical protein [Candidatus Neomarinimicrobiota bacterium]HRU92638.1 hypothetical protein [Candidatus Neomarinimicrobiota bacterium]
MKTNWLSLTLIILLSFAGQLAAQPDSFDESEATMAERREKMETLRIYKMTEFLALTPEQSEKFFPKLKQYEDNVRKMQHQQRQLVQEIDQITQNTDTTITESDVKKYLRAIAQIEKDIISEKEKFISGLSSILTPSQQLKYMIFDNRFRRHLMKSLNPPTGKIEKQQK